MVTLTLNGKKTECAGCYEELKTRHYQHRDMLEQLSKPIVERDHFKVFNILIDGEFKSYHATTENEVTIWNAIRWTVDQHFEFKDDVPKALEINGKAIAIPNNMGALSIGQNIHLRQILDKSKYLEENLSMATAIYLQPMVDNSKFDFERAKELEKVIGEMPAYLIKPIGFFLLSHAMTSGKGQRNFLKRILHNLSGRLKRMLPAWLSGKGSHHMQILAS